MGVAGAAAGADGQRPPPAPARGHAAGAPGVTRSAGALPLHRPPQVEAFKLLAAALQRPGELPDLERVQPKMVTALEEPHLKVRRCWRRLGRRLLGLALAQMCCRRVPARRLRCSLPAASPLPPRRWWWRCWSASAPRCRRCRACSRPAWTS